jgi:RNA polymerase sigma-70 factor (ECF subfamily)
MGAGALAGNVPRFTDEQLVEEAQAFSQEAWEHIYDRYYPKMFQYCYLRIGNQAASEDLASDVFLEALRGIRRYRYRGIPLAAWLYRIARNLTADFLRRNSVRPTVPLGAEEARPALQTPDETDSLALQQDMRRAIEQLTDDQQQVITLRFFQGLSHDEIAAVMGRRSGAVRVLQNRALKALGRIMAA